MDNALQRLLVRVYVIWFICYGSREIAIRGGEI
jgi:hypothetical protein